MMHFCSFVEVRDHGVGYYQFSKDEAERKSQMEALNQLRDQVTSFVLCSIWCLFLVTKKDWLRLRLQCSRPRPCCIPLYIVCHSGRVAGRFLDKLLGLAELVLKICFMKLSLKRITIYDPFAKVQLCTILYRSHRKDQTTVWRHILL